MKRSILIFLISVTTALASTQPYYCDSSNTVAGDGTFGNPYQSLSSLSWSSVSNFVVGGSNVVIWLKRGSVFREQLTIIASGKPASVIALSDYSTGEKPVISGATIYTNFAAYSGATYSNAASATPTYVFRDSQRMVQGGTKDTLENLQWIVVSSVIYFRDDGGNPATGHTVEGTTSAEALLAQNRSNLFFTNIVFQMASTYGAQCSGTNFWFDGCQFLNSGNNLYVNNLSNLTCRACIFDSGMVNQNINVDGASSTFDFYFCRIGPGRDANYGVNIAAGGNVGRIINCTFVGPRQTSFRNVSSAANLMLVNCIFDSTASGDNLGLAAATSTAGTVNMTNCMVLANGKDMTTPVALSGITSSNNLTYFSPQFAHQRYPAILIFDNDDGPNLNDWLQMANLATNYGYHACFAYSGTHTITASQSNLLRQAVLDGHEIACHSRYHSTLNEDRMFFTQYSGGASTATLSVANSNLTLQLDGTNFQVLSLTNSSYDTVFEVFTAINSFSGFACTNFDVLNNNLPSRLLTNIAAVNINGVAYTNMIHGTNRLYEEIVLAKSDLEAVLTNYTVQSFVYPGGGQNAAVIAAVTNAGYIMARGINVPPTDSYRISSNFVFLTSVAPNNHGPVCDLLLEGNSNDTSLGGQNFTASGVVYETTNVFHGLNSARMDGSTSFFYRADGSLWDWSFGDFVVSVAVNPAALGGTLFTQWQDSANYLRIALNSDGSVTVDGIANGSTVVNLTTVAGVVTNSGWQTITVQELWNLWKIRVNGIVQTTTSTAGTRLMDFSAPILLGCGTNEVGGFRTNFYRGLLDDFTANAKTYWLTASLCNMMGEEGDMITRYDHNLGQIPLEAWRVIFDAVFDYGGVQVMTHRDAANYIITNGIAYTGDNRIYGRFLTPAADYSLSSGSAAANLGLNSLFSGITNLHDLNSSRITDENGTLTTTSISLGALNFIYDKPTSLGGNITVTGNMKLNQ